MFPKTKSKSINDMVLFVEVIDFKREKEETFLI